MKGKHATFPQEVLILDLLRKHCSQNADGFAVYDDGWTDQEVADEAEKSNPTKALPIKKDAVARIRKQVIGKLKRATVDDDWGEMSDHLEGRIKALEDRFAKFDELRTFVHNQLVPAHNSVSRALNTLRDDKVAGLQKDLTELQALVTKPTNAQEH